MNQAVPFETVLRDELVQLNERRLACLNAPPAPDPAPNATLKDLQAAAFQRGMVGMGLSGGGIRSATLNLGILQGLTATGLLPYIDYLSTVSGGGYIGTWLHGLIYRFHNGDPRSAYQTLNRVVPLSPDRDPVAFLRKYSNFLAPRVSPFSADLWVILAIWIRNMFLNLLVLVPTLAAALMVPIALGISLEEITLGRWNPLNEVVSLLLFLAPLVVALVCMSRRLRWITRLAVKPGEQLPPEQGLSIFWCSVCVLCSAVLACVFRNGLLAGTITHFGSPLFRQVFVPSAALYALFFCLQNFGGFTECYNSRHKSRHNLCAFHLFWMPLVSTLFTLGLIWLLLTVLSGWRLAQESWKILAWGPPLLAACLMKGVAFLMGMMGSDYKDAAREWLSRMGATLSIICTGWMALFSIAVFMPYWLAYLFDTHWVVGTSALSGWLLTTAGGVLAGNSAKTKGSNDPKSQFSPLELLGKIAPTVFMIGFLTIISFGIHAGLRAFTGNTAPRSEAVHDQKIDLSFGTVEQLTDGIAFKAAAPTAAITPQVNNSPSWTRVVLKNHWPTLESCTVPEAVYRLLSPKMSPAVREGIANVSVWIAAVLLFLVSYLSALRININEFSMQCFYKNRLVRCYLGATHKNRMPEESTGFDPEDDLSLALLQASSGYRGPYPIVNTAVNISRGTELAKQERKADSFVFTPRYCGFTPMVSQVDIAATKELDKNQKPEIYSDGYRKTVDYAEPGGVQIGTAMGISGAAASPNMGYHTSGPLAFLLTVFNVRLGWWLGNPRRDDSADLPGPRFALWPLLSELAASTDERSKYVNLSDGGHFDNLGLIELVRRRCRFIIIGDGESDQGLAFESLASAMRKCRADFGVDIDIDLDRIRKNGEFSGVHCVTGTIKYPNQEIKGVLLYFKSSLTGDEPEDILQYRSTCPTFPHQSTADQFFDEAQFESYRQLGLHMVKVSLKAASIAENGDVGKFFDDVRNKLFRPTVGDDRATEHNNAYTALLQRLANDPDLRYLDHQILSGYGMRMRVPSNPEIRRRAFFFVADCIQLMENVYNDLLVPSDLENPGNKGWTSLFQHWIQQPAFITAWDQIKKNYNEEFVGFYEKDLRQGLPSEPQPEEADHYI